MPPFGGFNPIFIHLTYFIDILVDILQFSLLWGYPIKKIKFLKRKNIDFIEKNRFEIKNKSLKLVLKFFN